MYPVATMRGVAIGVTAVACSVRCPTTGRALWITLLFADTEAGKDPSQQIIRAERAGDLAQQLLCLTQILSQQLPGPRQGQLCATVLQRRAGMTQRLQVPAACAEAALRGLLIAHAGLEMVAQQFQAIAGRLCAQADGDMAVLAGFHGNGFAGQVSLVANQGDLRRVRPLFEEFWPQR